MRPQSVLASRLSSVRLRTRSALLRSELARRPARVLLLVLRSALLRSEEEWPQVDLSIASADCNEPALNQCRIPTSSILIRTSASSGLPDWHAHRMRCRPGPLTHRRVRLYLSSYGSTVLTSTCLPYVLTKRWLRWPGRWPNHTERGGRALGAGADRAVCWQRAAHGAPAAGELLRRCSGARSVPSDRLASRREPAWPLGGGPGRRLWSTCSECQQRLEPPTRSHPWIQRGRIRWTRSGIFSTKWMRTGRESLTSTRCESCASVWVRSSTTPRSLGRSARWTRTLREGLTCRCAIFARL